MASKTPVSILQEYTIRLGYVPLYQEMNDRNDKTFTYIVRCNTFSAKGTASNKKQAKQYAATEMLSLLMREKIIPQIPEISSKTESRTNSYGTESPKFSNSSTDSSSLPSSQSFINYVGKVQEYCLQKNLPNPVYEIIDVNGVAHCLEFTVSCTVSNIYEEASAANKKMAKQNAAKKMWEQISKMNNYTSSTDGSSKISGDKLLEDVNILQVKMEKKLTLELYEKPATYYKQVKNTELSSIPVSEHHLLFKTRHSEKISENKLLLLKSMLIQTNSNGTEQTDEMIRFVNDCFNFSIQEIYIATHQSEYKVIAMRIFDVPIIVQFGIGETVEIAKHRAVCNIIMCILDFLT